jgi:hypothetical protein
MSVERWRGLFFAFSTAIHTHPQQTHGQRFGATEVAFLRAKRLNSLHISTLNLSGGRNAPCRRKRPRSARNRPQQWASQVADLIEEHCFIR